MATAQVLLTLSLREADRLQHILDTLPWIEGPEDTAIGDRLRLAVARHKYQQHHQEPSHGQLEPVDD